MAEPEFIPKPGQVDYTTIRYAPVINTVIVCEGKLLLTQRSADMRLYPNYWSSVSGFLDDDKSIEEKATQELREELGVQATDIVSIERGSVLLQEAPQYHKTWLVVPVLVRIRTTDFTLDWEAQRAEWLTLDAAKKLNLLPGYEAVIDQFREMV